MGRLLAGNPSTVYAAREGEKFNADTTLTVVECPTCGITYAIPESLERSAHKHKGDSANGWKLCCPLGHSWWYVGETETQKLRRRLEQQTDRAGRLAAERDQAKAEVRGQKAAKTRIKNQRDRERTRVGNGVCPCCNRSFQNLRRHMASKHPDHAHDHADVQ